METRSRHPRSQSLHMPHRSPLLLRTQASIDDAASRSDIFGCLQRPMLRAPINKHPKLVWIRIIRPQPDPQIAPIWHGLEAAFALGEDLILDIVVAAVTLIAARFTRPRVS